MTVFSRSITTFAVVAAATFSGASYGQQWAYRAQPPAFPRLTHTQRLTNPTVAQIQSAIQPGARIIVEGTVDATAGDVLWVEENDVRLNFYHADVVHWRGGDTWHGFINISGQRVHVNHLRLEVQTGPGRCRGAMIFTPASDVRICNSEFRNTADGLVADGNWQRVAIMHTDFLDCGDWVNPTPDGPREGGYGIFLQDNDANQDHLRLVNVTVTLRPDATQHGVRISKVQNALIDNCTFGANWKRSFWAYGVCRMAIRNSTFLDGSVLFNLMDHEWYTDRDVRHVRMENCQIHHTGILEPLGIYCGRGTRDFRIRDLDVTSTTAERWLTMYWRTNSVTRNIRWFDGTIWFNGSVINGEDGAYLEQWAPWERQQALIGPMDDDRW